MLPVTWRRSSLWMPDQKLWLGDWRIGRTTARGAIAERRDVSIEIEADVRPHEVLPLDVVVVVHTVAQDEPSVVQLSCALKLKNAR
jgi:hypothetical protein